MIKFILNVTLFLSCSPAWATSSLITKVTSKSALADFEETPQVGDQFYAQDTDGNKVGILEVTKTKANKALLKIIWGYAIQDVELIKMERDTILTSQDMKNLHLENTKGKTPPIQLRSGDYLRSDKNSYGIMAGLSYATMNVNVKDSFGQTDTVSMKGLNFNAYAFYDYMFTPHFGARAALSYDQIRLSGTSSIFACSARTSQSCSANLDFASGQLLLKFQTTIDNYRMWLGAGYYYRYAINASSTAADTSNYTGDGAYSVDLGLDIGTKVKRYIPVSLEYVKPSSSTSVTSDLIFLRIGFGFY